MDYRKYLLICAVLFLLSGCASYVAHRIEHPDHSFGRKFEGFDEIMVDAGFVRGSIITHDGVRIAYWHGEPRAYHLRERFGFSNGQFNWSADLDHINVKEAPPLPVRGSIVLLHPWEGSGSMMSLWAYHFAAAGYVVVMPDLRSQGSSALAPVGYGPREGLDVDDLIRALRAGHLLPDPLFLMGVSYGGTTALFAAQHIDDVRGVIAMEPYDNAAEVIRRAPESGLFAPRWIGHLIGKRAIDRGISRASHDLGVDLDHIDVAGALDGTTHCTLILHGSRDNLIPAEDLRPLVEHSAAARYVELDGENHLTLMMRTDRLAAALMQWLQQAVDASGVTCPSIDVPPP